MPFAGYKDFDDCVRKNRSKKDPQAYCATIMRKVEEGMKPTNAIEILNVSEAEFTKDEATGKMVADFVLIKAGRAINPRTYRPNALQKAVKEGTYNGVRMFVDHGDKPPLKRSMREMVSAVESTEWDPRVGSQGGIRGHAEIFDSAFFEYAQRAKKYIGVSANHQIEVQYVKEGSKSIQDVISIPQAYSVDWVLYPSAGGEILGFARESEGADQVEWSDITIDTLKANAPQLVDQLRAELSAKEEEEKHDDPPAPASPTKEEIAQMVREGVQSIMDQVNEQSTKRANTSKSVQEYLSKSGLPSRVQARIALQFVDSLEYVEEDVKAKVDDAKEELKELGFEPKIKGEGPTGTASGGKPTTTQAREGVESIFGVKKN